MNTTPLPKFGDIKLPARVKPKAAPVLLHPELTAQIIKAHEAAIASAEDAVRRAIHCGELLLKVKSECKHGSFGTYCKSLPFGDRMVQRYMQAAAWAKSNPTRVSEIASLRGLLSLSNQGAEARGKADRPRTPTVVAKQAPSLQDEVSTLSETARQKFERLVKRLLAEFDYEVGKRVREAIPERIKALDEQKAELAAEVADWQLRNKAVHEWMTHEEYRLVLGCLHPDRQAADMPERTGRAFDIFRRLGTRFKPKTKRNGAHA